MNDILSRALSFSSQTKSPETDQDSLYQAKYIAALEEKLKITQERDTMIRVLEEKNAQLESLIKYSAELERKLGISANVVAEEKTVSWLDVVRKYFKSFNDNPDLYDLAVKTFITDRNLVLEKVESDCSSGKLYYGIPTQFHVEFAAYFSDLWQKGLHKGSLCLD
jgi:hypothetical protein